MMMIKIHLQYHQRRWSELDAVQDEVGAEDIFAEEHQPGEPAPEDGVRVGNAGDPRLWIG